MATATLMSVEEFAALPEDGQMHELVEGELLTMPPPHSLHARILNRILVPLARFALESGLGEAFPEAGYQLQDDPPTVRQPDISFQAASRLAAQPGEGYFRGAPDLAIEILSPSNSAEDVRLQVRQYFAAGATAVAIVYPRTREIVVDRPGQSAQTFEIGDILRFPDVLPGGSLAVAEIFAPTRRTPPADVG